MTVFSIFTLQTFANFHAIRSWSFHNICNEIGWPRFLRHVHALPGLRIDARTTVNFLQSPNVVIIVIIIITASSESKSTVINAGYKLYPFVSPVAVYMYRRQNCRHGDPLLSTCIRYKLLVRDTYKRLHVSGVNAA